LCYYLTKGYTIEVREKHS